MLTIFPKTNDFKEVYGVFYAIVVHLKNGFMCIVRTFHEFHANVVFPANCMHFLTKSEIMCDNHIQTSNIVQYIAQGCALWKV